MPRATRLLSRTRNITAGIALAAFAVPALAASDTMLKLLEVLHAKGTLDAETYAALKAAADEEAATTTVKHDEVKAAAAALPKVETKGKLEIVSPDGNFSWRLGGRFQLDAATHSNDNGRDTTGASRSTALADGTDFRRARLDVTANLWRVWQAKLQYDFTGSGAGGIRDAWIRYMFKDGQPGYLQVGNFKEPFSLDELTGANSDPFMEQALPTVFYPSRNIGIQGSTWGHNLWTTTLGFFGGNVGTVGNEPGCSATITASTGAITPCTGDASEGYAVTGRLTVSPIHTETSDRVLHRKTVAASASRHDRKPLLHATPWSIRVR
jgi:phosphate-selective porin OprO and OprP